MAIPFIFLLLAAALSPALAADITPSEVFAEAVRIERETALLEHHLGVSGAARYQPVEADLKPRHVWARAHMLLAKIDIFRRHHGMVATRPVAIEPVRELEPFYAWEQVRRILTEIAIIKKRLGLIEQIEEPPVVESKRPIDTFNQLGRVSARWNLLIGGMISPSDVYAQVLRLNEDVNLLLRHFGVIDTAVPPAKELQAQPADSLAGAFAVLEELRRLQGSVGIEPADLEVFRANGAEVLPEDVFNLVEMLLAEIQTIKAQRGLVHAVTPAAEHYEGKRPADVLQLLGYVRNKLRLVRTR